MPEAVLKKIGTREETSIGSALAKTFRISWQTQISSAYRRTIVRDFRRFSSKRPHAAYRSSQPTCRAVGRLSKMESMDFWCLRKMRGPSSPPSYGSPKITPCGCDSVDEVVGLRRITSALQAVDAATLDVYLAMSRSRVLVTGSDGFVGRHVVEALVSHGDHVVAAQRSITSRHRADVEVTQVGELGAARSLDCNMRVGRRSDSPSSASACHARQRPRSLGRVHAREQRRHRSTGQGSR